MFQDIWPAIKKKQKQIYSAYILLWFFIPKKKDLTVLAGLSFFLNSFWVGFSLLIKEQGARHDYKCL